MNCNTATGYIIQGDTYHKIFEFYNPDETPMDLSVFTIWYGLKLGNKVYYEKSTGFDITDNVINIEIPPADTIKLPSQTYKEIFIFTLISDTTEVKTMYSGNVAAEGR